MTPSRVCTLAPDICVIKSNFALLDVCHFHSWAVVVHTSRTWKVEMADPSEFSLVSTKQVTHVSITSIDHHDHFEQKLLQMVLYIPNLGIVLKTGYQPI